MQPLFYAALSFAAGIALAALAPMGLRPWAWPSAAAAALALSIPVLTNRRPRWLVPVALLGCLAGGLGRGASVLNRPAAPSPLAERVRDLEPGPRDRVWLTGYLRDDPDVRDGEARLDLEVESISTAAALTPKGAETPVWPVAGGVRLYSYRSPRDSALGSLDEEPGFEVPEAESAASAPVRGWPGTLGRLRAGDALAVTVHLRPLTVPRDPGVFESVADLQRQGIGFSATLADGAWQPWQAGGPAPRALVLRARIWSWLSAGLDALVSPRRQPRVNALLRGMLLGDTERLDPAGRQALQIDGVYHLVVVAGLHIGILAAFFLLVFRGLRMPPWRAELATLLLLGGYCWIIVGRTPTLRALLMLAVYFGARRWYRRPQALNAVGAAALLLLWHRPGDLFAPGWQMSLGAATLLAGLARPMIASTSAPCRHALSRLDEVEFDEALAPRWAQFRLDLRALTTRLGWIWRPLGGDGLPALLRALLRLYEIALISVVLQIGFAAFNAVYFHRANPWAAVANLVLVPAAALLIPLAWCGIGLEAFAGALHLAWLGAMVRAAASTVVGGCGALMLRGAAAIASWPAAGVRVPSPPQWFLFCFAAAMAGWIAIWIPMPAAVPGNLRWRRPALTAAAGLTLAMAVAMAVFPFAPRLPPGLSATILDVGQGDSIFVSFPDGRTLLVDAGPRSPNWDSGEQIVAPFLWGLGLRHLDAVLLTHGHNDHLGGLPAIVRDFHPTEVWVTWTLPSEPAVTAFLRQAIASGARLRRCRAGQQFLAGPVRLAVLLPSPAYRSGELASNDDSMTVRLSYGAQSMLLTGDTEASGERWMLDRHLPLASQMLKVGHHGSRTSSTAEFLAAVAPQVAIISDGAGNLYGHPAPEVLERLAEQGARVYRTDRDGAVQCRLDGRRLSVYLFPPTPFAASP